MTPADESTAGLAAAAMTTNPDLRTIQMHLDNLHALGTPWMSAKEFLTQCRRHGYAGGSDSTGGSTG